MLPEAGRLAVYCAGLSFLDIVHLGWSFTKSGESVLWSAPLRAWVLHVVEIIWAALTNLLFGHRFETATAACPFDWVICVVMIFVSGREIVRLMEWEPPTVFYEHDGEKTCEICHRVIEKEIDFLACGGAVHASCLMGYLGGGECPVCRGRECLKKTEGQVALTERVKRMTDRALMLEVTRLREKMDQIVESVRRIPRLM
jgi:hypothetical protein